MQIDVDPARRFGGIDRLYGTGSINALRAAHACVIGIGGVGSWAVEALARSGVGRLTLIDLDHVAESNINRQAHALDATLGTPQGQEALSAGIRSGTADARQSAYDAAYAVPIDYSSNNGKMLESLFSRVPAAAWKQLREPVLAQAIQANAAIDVGDTLVGMHIRPVAVPLRGAYRCLGSANLVQAYSRLPYIGGARAVYEE